MRTRWILLLLAFLIGSLLTFGHVRPAKVAGDAEGATGSMNAGVHKLRPGALHMAGDAESGGGSP